MALELLLVRHAIAEEPEDFAKTGKSDELRPLTPEGKAKMRKGARAVRRLFPELDLVASSPLKRAVQTAAILRKEFPRAGLEEVEAFRPDASFAEVLRWLKGRKGVVAAVGHEPHLGHLIGYLSTGRTDLSFPLKKGAICLLVFQGRPAAGGARVECFLQPSELRKFAGNAP